MNKKFIVLFVAIVAALICISPMAAAENTALSQYALLDFNLFGNSNAPPFEIEDMKILKVNKKHIKSNGNVKKSTKSYLKFNVKSDSDFDSYKIKIKCLDKKNKTVKTVKSHIDHDGNYKIPLKNPSKMKGAKLAVYNDNGDVILKEFTSKIKVDKKVIKDKPVVKKKKTTSSSSSSSGTTYWASSNSDIFHYPGCEWAQKISGRNKVVFHSRSDALNSGFRPCHVCSP
jgi:hypothetical protein